jgi:phage portal protein BeeE
VGIRAALRLARSAELTTAATLGGGDVAQVSNLPTEVAQAFGINVVTDLVDRRTAMSIPAVRRGRQVIAGTIGALPLIARRDRAGQVDHIERPLLVQPDPNTTRQHVLTWTVDDLIFGGISWWRVTSRDNDGYPLTAERLHPSRVTVVIGTDGEASVYVDGRPANDADMIRFDGPDEGVIVYGGRALRTAIMLEEAVRRFATLDVPLGYLSPEDGAEELSTLPGTGNPDDPTDTRSEVDVLLDSWESARAKRTTAYLNRAIKYDTVQFDAERIQLADARQHQAAELARLLNLPPRYVNAPQASAMTYSTTESDRRDLVDTTLAPYLAAIEQRLSMGDVTPRGTVVLFDLTDFLRGDTLQALQAAQIAVNLRAMNPLEVRSRVLRLEPFTADNPQPPPPAPAPAPPGGPAA